MSRLDTLIDKLPQMQQSRLVANGSIVWMTWSGQLAGALEQTLADHGGIYVGRENNMALWFFHSEEVFRALARLQIWARLNPLALTFVVLPGSLLVGFDMQLSASVATEFRGQEVLAPKEFEAWIHPKVKEGAKKIPGIELRQTNPMTGLIAADWKLLYADPGYQYDSQLTWFFMIRPLGNASDKEFVAGWRVFKSGCEEILQRHGLKYVSGENNMIVPLDNRRTLRDFTREVVQLVRDLKADPEGKYWPVVMGVMEKGKHNLTDDLPRKINLDWNRLAPDYPHIAYKWAFLLGNDFKLQDVSFSLDRGSIDDWCSVSLVAGASEQAASASLSVRLPRKLLGGSERCCFYCGLNNHKPAQCPSRNLHGWYPEVWAELAKVNVEDINTLSRTLDEKLGSDPVDALTGILQNTGSPDLLARAIYENTVPFQLRFLHMLWRSRSKDWQGVFSALGPEEGEYIWSAMEAFRTHNEESAEQLLGQAMVRYPRGYQPRSLVAFVNMESKDWNQAFFYWQEAERFSYTPVQKAEFFMLQARLLEVQNEFEKAIGIYKTAEREVPAWLDPVYRQGVCLVKMGFAEHAMGIFTDLVQRDANYFNRILVDPELERGRFHLLAAISDIWDETRDAAKAAARTLEDIGEKLHQWFPPDNEFADTAMDTVERLRVIAKVDNFVAFKRLISGVQKLDREIKVKVDEEVKVIEGKVGTLLDQLMDIQREASWFPFPKLLREFNRDFNFCADKLNWMQTQHLRAPEAFRKSQQYVHDIEEKLVTLRGRLVTLRIIRDATFFILLLGRNFIWLELIGLGLAIVLVPLFVYFTQASLEGWMMDMLQGQKWQMQKVLVLALSFVALVAAILRTAVSFEKKKEQLFTEEYEKLSAEYKERKKKKKARYEERQKRLGEKKQQAREANSAKGARGGRRR